MTLDAIDTTIDALFKTGRPERYKKGDLIFGMDPTPKGVYLIESGFIKFYSITDQGEENVIVILGAGELFPLMWAYLGWQSEMYGEALNNTTTWRIPREHFTSFAQEDAQGGYLLAQQMAKQFQVFNGRLENLEYKRSNERVAFRLLFLANRFGKRQGKNVVIDAPITQELLAQTINLTRESVSRELNKLERAGIIKYRAHRAVILDAERLRQQLSRLGSLQHISK